MAVSSPLHHVGDAFDEGSAPLELPDDAANRRPLNASADESFGRDERRIDRAVLAFVALGVLLRVGHYLANYPLWGDEAFLALSFLRRGYLDLLLPLEYGQICSDPLPVGRADGGQTVRILGDVAAALSADLRSRERLSVPTRWPAVC